MKAETWMGRNGKMRAWSWLWAGAWGAWGLSVGFFAGRKFERVELLPPESKPGP